MNTIRMKMERRNSNGVHIPQQAPNTRFQQPPNLTIAEHPKDDVIPKSFEVNENAPTTGTLVKYESIVPCFISQHVKISCDEMCWETWTEAQKEFAAEQQKSIPEINAADSASQLKNVFGVEDIFKSKITRRIKDMEPGVNEHFAAVVMADVSGYSNLSSVLAERGAEGAEILSRTMKGYLDKIIDIILKHGGDIVKFAGDAVIFYWKMSPNLANPTNSPNEDSAKGEVVLKAAHCCLDLLKQLGSYEVEIPQIGQKVLAIHLGIGAGNVFDVQVGGIDRWEHFIAGDAVNQLASVLDLAKAGELALSHQALRWFSCIVEIASVGIGAYDKKCIILTGLENAKRKTRLLPEDSTEQHTQGGFRKSSAIQCPNSISNLVAQYPIVQAAAFEMYKLFVNPSALCKLQTDINQSRLFRVDAGLLDLMSLRESRQITTIFIKIGSLTKWEDKMTLDASQQSMTIVQEALRKYEGSLRQMHVDDKGATILIFFGLPPLAHENDAKYGVQAGLEILGGFLDTVDEFSIGITTGVVSIGGVGNENRIEYAVMGDSINMAARLMCNSKSQQSILCDERTFNLCDSEFLFEALGEIKVKGKNHPISIYKPKKARPDSMKNQVSPENFVVVGRENERKKITDSLEAHGSQPGPRMLLAEADGGMGLSTLARWTKMECEKAGFYIGTGFSAQMEKTTRFYIWRDIICDILTGIESMQVNESRIANLSETRTPTFLMDKVDNIEKGSGSEDDHSSKQNRSVGLQSFQRRGIQKSGMLSSARRNDKDTQSSANTASMQSPAKKSSKITSSRPGRPGVSSDALHSTSQNRLKAVPSSEALGVNNQPIISEALQRKWQAFEERLRQAFIKCGESPAQAALMNLVFPYDFTESEIYTKLQGKFRINELTDLLRRVINVLTEETPMVIMIHESQWMDPLSWELLWELGITCPKVMIGIFSRPEKYYESDETRLDYQKFIRHQNSIHFILEGLNLADTAKLIISNYPAVSTPISSVQKNISENLCKRTGGNPLYIKSVVVALKESGQCKISDDGELRMAKDDFDFEKLVNIGDNLQSIIVAQLDRLDSNFQLFLKVSSVLGQPFLLEDVLYLLSDSPGFNVIFQVDTAETIITQIKNLDKYSFLQRLDGDSEGILMQYKSLVVKKCIYSMMVTSQRQQLHLNVACYFEKLLDTNNRHRLLLPLYEHYAETDEKQTGKKVSYLEAVAHVYFEKNLMGEAIKHYNSLLELAETAAKLAENPMTFDAITRSTWHRELGEAYNSRGEDQKCEYHLLECLNLLGQPFPKNSLILGWKVRSQATKRAQFPIPLSGDAQTNSAPSQNRDVNDHSSHESLTNSSTVSKAYEEARILISSEMAFDPMAIELAEMIRDKKLLGLHNIRRAMSVLAQLYLNSGRIKEHVYAVLRGTNVSEGFPHDALYARFLSMCGALSWFSEGKKRMALRYLEAASKHDRRLDLSQTVSIILSTALTLFLMGKWGSSMRRLAALPFLEMMSGDFSMRAEALRMRAIVIHLSGARSQSAKASKDLYMMANQESNWEGQLWGCKLILANMLTTSEDSEILEMSNMLKSLWAKAPENHKHNPGLAINVLGLTAQAEFRFNNGFKLSTFVKALVSISSDLTAKKKRNSYSASNGWGGGCTSAGGPQQWLGIIGLVHCGSVLVDAFEAVVGNDTADRKSVGKVCKEIENWLGTGQIMKHMTLSHPVRYLFKGIRYLIKHKSQTGAIGAWKKALACRRVSDLLYVRGVLHMRIAKYSNHESECNHHAHEAQKLLRRIGATYEFEKASALRKDKKKNGRKVVKKDGKIVSGEASESEPDEVEKSFGEKSYGESKSFGGQSYGDKSYGDQSSMDDRSDLGY